MMMGSIDFIHLMDPVLLLDGELIYEPIAECPEEDLQTADKCSNTPLTQNKIKPKTSTLSYKEKDPLIEKTCIKTRALFHKLSAPTAKSYAFPCAQGPSLHKIFNKPNATTTAQPAEKKEQLEKSKDPSSKTVQEQKAKEPSLSYSAGQVREGKKQTPESASNRTFGVTLQSSKKQESGQTNRSALPQQTHNRSSYNQATAWQTKQSEEWWEMRAQRKDKEREGGGQQQGQQEEGQQQHRDSCYKVEASCEKNNIARSNTSFPKPQLQAPRLGVFALYYVLTKIEIHSNATSNFAAKIEIESLDAEMNETHKQRLDEMKEALKKERQTKRWGIAMKVFSWIASLFAVIAGAIMIATGVGAIAGALLIAAGTIQIGSQIMEITGGWNKVADILPSDDAEKKRSVISWMQMGIAILCLLLTLGGVVIGGISSFQEAMSIVSSAIQSVAASAQGIVTIGEGIEQRNFRNRLAEVKTYDVKLMKLKNLRQELMDKVELGVERLEKLFEEMAQALKFEEELFEADQMAQGR